MDCDPACNSIDSSWERISRQERVRYRPDHNDTPPKPWIFRSSLDRHTVSAARLSSSELRKTLLLIAFVLALQNRSKTFVTGCGRRLQGLCLAAATTSSCCLRLLAMDSHSDFLVRAFLGYHGVCPRSCIQRPLLCFLSNFSFCHCSSVLQPIYLAVPISPL